MEQDSHTINKRKDSSGEKSALESDSKRILDAKSSSPSLKYTGDVAQKDAVPRNNISSSSHDRFVSEQRPLPRITAMHDSLPPNIDQSKVSSLSEFHQRQRQQLYDSSQQVSQLLGHNGHGGREEELPPLYRAETQGFIPQNNNRVNSSTNIGTLPSGGVGQTYGAGSGTNTGLRPSLLLQQHRYFNSGSLAAGNYSDPRTALFSSLAPQLYMQHPNRLPGPSTLPMTMRYTSLGNAGNFNNSVYSNMAGSTTHQQMYGAMNSVPRLSMGLHPHSDELALASALARTSREQMELAAAMPHATQNYLTSSSVLSGRPPQNPTNNLSALGIPAPQLSMQGTTQGPGSIFQSQQRFADERSGVQPVEFNQFLGTPASALSSMGYGDPNTSGFAVASAATTTTDNPKRQTESSDGSTSKPKRRRRVVKRFEERFKDLVAFKGRYGHCDVPHKWKEDLSLGKWCSNIRISYKHLCRGLKPAINLKPDQIEQLNDIGFKWKVKKYFKSFDGHFEDLMQFKKKFGHCDVPWDFNEDPSLGAWCCGIRKAYSQIQEGKSYASINKYLQLTEERVKKLDEANFTWVFPS